MCPGWTLEEPKPVVPMQGWLFGVSNFPVPGVRSRMPALVEPPADCGPAAEGRLGL